MGRVTTLLPSQEPTRDDVGASPDDLGDQLREERALFDARDTARSAWMVIGVVLAGIALIGSTLAIGWAVHADSRRGVATVGLVTVKVELSEFKISPAMVNASVGDTLKVLNQGTAAHQLSVQGTALATANIAPGQSATLDTSSLQPGDYTIFCSVPGHQAAGMQAMLRLRAGTGSIAAAPAPAGLSAQQQRDGMTMSPADMAAGMKSSTLAFPAKTKGLGGQDLAPTILPDGTKQFSLTSQVVDWEVSPGKTVRAWTYNGTVPGPTIKVDPGDKVAVVLTNQLPEATTVHFHGIIGPAEIDGTPYLNGTAPIEPGQTHTYSWTAQTTPAVGMYHSHFDAVLQVEDGMAGAFLIGSMPVPAQALAQGAPAQLTNQLMFLNDSGSIGLSLNGKSFPATAPYVVTQGQWLEVTYFNEGQMIHPMHLHEEAQMIIARDGYPLGSPELDDTITVAPGQRITILVHAVTVGAFVWHCHILQHAEGAQGMFGMVTALVVKPATATP